MTKHFGPGGVFAIPTLKPFNATKNCFECGTSFSLFKQKYHCRNCGNVVCNSCSDHRHSLKKFGYENPVRCCITCDKLINMQNMNSSELSKLPPKALKEYIHAYNLPFKTAIEKSDLVRIIFNTRPISNQSENYYRKHRNKQPTNEDGGHSFSFTNIVQEIFSPPTPNNRQQEQEQARQQHEEHIRRQREEEERQARIRRQEQERQDRIRREERQARRQQEEEQRRMREQTQSTSPPPSQSYSPPPARSASQPASPLSNDKVLTLHDLIKNKIDPSSLSVRTLKSILQSNYVKQSHVIEKSELVKLVIRLIDQHKAEIESNKKNDEDDNVNEDSLCRICYDKQQNCVFLDCGHMATCIECAKKLIETRNECPICREPILKLVHVFRS